MEAALIQFDDSLALWTCICLPSLGARKCPDFQRDSILGTAIPRMCALFTQHTDPSAAPARHLPRDILVLRRAVSTKRQKSPASGSMVIRVEESHLDALSHTRSKISTSSTSHRDAPTCLPSEKNLNEMVTTELKPEGCTVGFFLTDR